MSDITQLLREGIQAIKAGQPEQGRALLMEVIALDEANERAWLWLSGTVESDEERRVCLENVLTINPQNEVARKGLARLQPVLADEIELPPSFVAAEEDKPVDEIALPPSLEARAAQTVSPTPEVEKGWWQETTFVEKPNSGPLKQYYDVWSNNQTICAYCAAPIERLQSRCPRCKRALLVKSLLNPIPSKHHGRLFIWMIIYLALFAGLVLLLFIVAPDVSPPIDRANLLTEGLAASLPLIAATVGVYQRQPWAYWLLLVLAIAEAGAFIWLLGGLLTAMEEIGTIGFFVLSSKEPSLLIGMFVFIVLLIALFLNAYTIYMAGGDFKRIPVRRIATVNERIKDPGLLDRIAQRLAQEEQWASAVLHWQHAVGRASGHAPYLLRLGHAYAELGFYERSIDILKTALEKVRSPEVRQEVEEELARVAQLWRAQESPAA